VERLCRGCFDSCESLSTVIFKSDSRLSCVENSAFRHCWVLSSIWIPSSLERVLCEYQTLLRFHRE
jgi:hypothetical protein